MFQNVPLGSFRRREYLVVKDHARRIRLFRLPDLWVPFVHSETGVSREEKCSSTLTVRAAHFCAEFFFEPLWRLRNDEKIFVLL